MLIKPPIITQPQPINKNNSVLEEKKIQSIPNNTESGTILTKETNPIVSNKEEGTEIIIRNKKAYKRFIQLIKKGKFTTAMLTAKIVGVERNTIMKWLKTKAIMDCMNEEVNNYISKIQVSKDWKAQAYLLDKTLQTDSKDSPTHDINSLIVINT